MNSVAAPEAPGKGARSREHWRERSAKLFVEFRGPATGMLRRAFGRTFGDDEIEDIYSGAWLGTLRALERREAELSDEEIRRYLLTAVAHQASKELRRRRRRPTSPLDGAPEVPDQLAAAPDERAASSEERGLARELLTTLPPRRRAVMMLRYGWGLEPSQVCGLVDGLSPRAYRKEITRGVDELTVKMRKVEQGEWCADREPLLKAYAAGLADDDQERQAKHHLSNCRSCSEFVGRLAGHLHDLGSGAVLPLALGGGGAGAGSRLGVLDRVRELASGGEVGDATSVAQSGAVRGGGTAGAGVVAKIAGLGAGGKLVAACLAGGAAAVTCIAVGVAPNFLDPSSDAAAHRSAPAPAHASRSDLPAGAHSAPVTLERPPVIQPAPQSPPAQTTPKGDPGTKPSPAQPASPVAPTAAPAEVEFGVASAAKPATSSTSSSGDSFTASGSGGSPESSAIGAEFGP